MRKLVITLLLATLYAAAARSQVGSPRRDVAIGVTAGVTLNSVSFEPTVMQTQKMSPMFGFALRYNCEKYFKSLCGLQFEVNYCNLGWEQDFSSSLTPELSYKRDMHYVNMPIMARMGWGHELKGLLGYVVAGPQLGFLLSEKETMSEELEDVDTSLSVARRAQYGKACQNKFEYGITAGCGVELNTRRAGHYMIEARYYLGLSNIFNNSKSDYFGRSTNNTITVKFSYLFDILRTKR